MIFRTRFLVAAAFVCHLLSTQLSATSQLHCPPVTHTSKDDVTICAIQQEKVGPIFKTHIRGKIDYRSYTLWADEATYNEDTDDVTVDGHVVVDGGPNNEHIEASHGTYNVRTDSGHFYDAVGTIGNRKYRPRMLLTTSNPFAFTGKVVDKIDTDHYVVHNGTVTSCKLPHPKWQFNMHRAVVTPGDNAIIYFSNFRIRGLPIFYFPYATHPLERQRQSGFLTPNFGRSSTKGTILGDSFYWAINRSMDAEIGAQYFSRRGWAQHGNFRARPSDNSYLGFNYFGVMDRGIGTPKVSQGGEEVRFSGADRFGHNFRVATDVDYLSSFIFRLAFYEVFNQAVNSEVRSQGFLSNTTNGVSYNAFVQRYQDFQSTRTGDLITILHTPSFNLSTVDQEVGNSPFYWNFETGAEGLSRSEPTFRSSRLVGRFDINPSLSLPMLFRGWSLRPEIGLRDTLYSQQLAPANGLAIASSDPVNRKALETSVELRPPAVERVFDRGLFGRKLKHVIEPRVVYRSVIGVDNFSKILRFDERDILTNTNEVEYGAITRLFAKRNSSTAGCSTAAAASSDQTRPPQTLWDPFDEEPDVQQPRTSDCPAVPTAHEIVSWELTQKYFLDRSFGGALVSGTRNVFTTTADFTAIAFLTSPRHLSPLVSRLRIGPISNVDAEWDLDYDFKSGRINASNVLANFHFGEISVGGGDSYLYIPADILSSSNTATSFHQFRTQVTYGHLNKPGLTGSATFGFDANQGQLQYSAVQATYNWDCCGITVEYRRFALTNIRDESQYVFTYSLANIGAFGNLTRRLRLY
jgi:LPS-assembly protein